MVQNFRVHIRSSASLPAKAYLVRQLTETADLWKSAQFAREVHRGNRFYVPAFDRHRVEHMTSSAAYCVNNYALERGGELQARVSVFQYPDSKDPNFGFFDCRPETPREALRALFQVAFQPLLDQGVRTIKGPINGNLGQGFAVRLPPIDRMPYFPFFSNRQDYAEKLRSQGFKTDITFRSYEIPFDTQEFQTAMQRVGRAIRRRDSDIRLRWVESSTFDRDLETVHDLQQIAFQGQWGFRSSAFEDAFPEDLRQILKIIVPSYMMQIAEVRQGEHWKLAGFIWAYPDYSYLMRRVDGRYPEGIRRLHWLPALAWRIPGKQHIPGLRNIGPQWGSIMDLAILPEYHNRNVSGVLGMSLFEEMVRHGWQGCGAGLIMENNFRSFSLAEKLGGKIVSRYEGYTVDLASICH